MENFLKDCRELHIPVKETDLEDYFRDESRFSGHASALIRARGLEDVVHVMRLAYTWSIPVTVVSGKTSLTGGPVPLGEVILDVKRLDALDPDDPTNVGPGIVLKQYKDWVSSKGLHYPPDPTSQDSCTLGGTVATNASGASSYLFGPTRDYIHGLTIVLPGGSVLKVERGEVVSSSGVLRVPGRMLMPETERDLVIPVPRTGVSPWRVCKNSAGLFSEEPMDLVDLFIGSEGILGVIVNVKTVLLSAKKPRFSLMLFVPDARVAVDLVTLLDLLKRFFHDRDSSLKDDIAETLNRLTGAPVDSWQDRFSRVIPCCMEWFGSSVAPFLSIDRARRLEAAYGALFVEQEYPAGQDPTDTAAQWADLLEAVNGRLAETLGAIESEVALDEKHIRGLRDDRHRVPERLNESIRPGMVKIATDFAVPMKHLGTLLSLYDERLPKGKSYVFGHIGNAHLHANMVPDNTSEEQSFQALYKELAREICKLGGSVAGEHGIGKLKREALRLMIGENGVEEIKRVKKTLDPKGLLNPQDMVS